MKAANTNIYVGGTLALAVLWMYWRMPSIKWNFNGNNVEYTLKAYGTKVTGTKDITQPVSETIPDGDTVFKIVSDGSWMTLSIIKAGEVKAIESLHISNA